MLCPSFHYRLTQGETRDPGESSVVVRHWASGLKVVRPSFRTLTPNAPGTLLLMRIAGIPGLGAAAALAAVTLGVFATFQNYGPESAVRRFHHAVANQNLAELSQVIAGSPSTSAVHDLGVKVDEALKASNANYRIVKSERSPTQVEMLALYQGRPPIIWVVVKARDRWRIDPYLTLQASRKLAP